MEVEESSRSLRHVLRSKCNEQLHPYHSTVVRRVTVQQ